MAERCRAAAVVRECQVSRVGVVQEWGSVRNGAFLSLPIAVVELQRCAPVSVHESRCEW